MAATDDHPSPGIELPEFFGYLVATGGSGRYHRNAENIRVFDPGIVDLFDILVIDGDIMALIFQHGADVDGSQEGQVFKNSAVEIEKWGLWLYDGDLHIFLQVLC